MPTAIPAGSGRIHPHQRNANFTGTIIGDSIVLDDHHIQNVQSTEQYSIDTATKRGHRNRIRQIYTAWEEHFPEYYQLGVKTLSADELQDPTKYYWKNKKDILYEGLNSKFLKAFISMKVVKTNGKTCSYDNIRKYFDAVQFGAKEADILLPIAFYKDKDKFLLSFKKQVAKAKGSGEVDEKEADPIPMSLFVLICTWAVGEGNLLVWAWSILQWNLMARSINVEGLAFHNIKVFQDTIQFKYDSNKADPTGDNVSIKHIYSNPLKPFICSFLSLAIYLCLNVQRFTETEHLFKSIKCEKKRVASTNYCSQLKELLFRKSDVVKTYLRMAHANAHGWRKGSATYATSGTTAPPPTPSVARRGEWSMGKVLDIYWKCCEIGDYYLGRVLAGLNPLLATFNMLPPHFKCEDPMGNADIHEAMQMMYGPILKRWGGTACDPTSVLLRLLASVVYHMEWIRAVARKRTDHPFNSIPLMFTPELVVALKLLVTTDPSPVIVEPTGIPPHVETVIKLSNLLEVATECLVMLKNQVLDIKKVSYSRNLNTIFIHDTN